MVQVYELSGGDTLTQLGSDVTGSFESPNTSLSRVSNRGIIFNGLELIYHQNTIRERDSGGAGTWGITNTFALQNSSGGYSYHSGLYEITDEDGSSLLVGAYLANTASWVLFTSTDGTTYNTQSVTGNISTGSVGAEILFDNKLFLFVSASSGNVVVFDFIAGTGDVINGILPVNIINADFCVLNGELFMAYLTSVSGGATFNLAQYQGATFVDIGTFPGLDSLGGAENGGLCLFTDNTDLFCVVGGRVGGSEGQNCFRVVDPGLGTQAITDVTAAGANSTNGVIPAGLQPGGGSIEESQWSCFVNSETDPANPEIYLAYLTGPGLTGTIQFYAFTDFNTTLTTVGTGGISSDVYLVDEKRGGGSRVITGTGGGKIYADIVDHSELVSGNVQISYRVYGSGSDVTGTLFASGGQSIAATSITITAASGGSSSASGGDIIDITPE